MKDSDLSFLSSCSNEQLKTLVDILVFDRDGKKRLTEELSNTIEFSNCYPNNLKPLISQIENEIQRFGGNTIMNVFRGHGVTYREILQDVCDRMKVNYNKKLSTPLIESELLRKVAVTVIEKMTEEDIKQIDANLDKTRFIDAIMNNNGMAIMPIIAVIISQLSKKTATQGALMLFGRALAPKVFALAVPIVNVLAAISTVADVASPAYRVTIPFTITVAFIRRQQMPNSELINSLFA